MPTNSFLVSDQSFINHIKEGRADYFSIEDFIAILSQNTISLNSYPIDHSKSKIDYINNKYCHIINKINSYICYLTLMLHINVFTDFISYNLH